MDDTQRREHEEELLRLGVKKARLEIRFLQCQLATHEARMAQTSATAEEGDVFTTIYETTIKKLQDE